MYEKFSLRIIGTWIKLQWFHFRQDKSFMIDRFMIEDGRMMSVYFLRKTLKKTIYITTRQLI